MGGLVEGEDMGGEIKLEIKTEVEGVRFDCCVFMFV
jgi:hypothetical protein